MARARSARVPVGRQPRRSARGVEHRPAGPAGPLVIVAAVSIGLLSLLFPSTPTYDAWAWLIWAREIVHVDLVTQGGPSWKPLPVLIDIPFALLGDDVAPSLWLVVARVAGALALLFALRLGWTLAGPGLPGAAGAAIAALGILTMTGWLQGVALGRSEGMLIALVLAALDRHLAGRRDQAFLLGAGAALLRPEVWPFLAVYGVVLWSSHPRRRAGLLVAGLFVLALWFLPELWGSGNLLRSAERANDPRLTSIAYADRPALEVLRVTDSLLVAPLYAAALVAVCAAIVAFRRRRALNAVLPIAGLAAGWTGLIMLMTEAGFSGTPRYLMIVGALTSVLAGVGVARLVRTAADAAQHFGGRAQAGAAVATAVLVGMLALTWPGRDLTAGLRAVRSQSAATTELEQLVARLGGPAAVLECGRPTADPLQRPIMAWTLGVHARDVAVMLDPGAPGLVFRMGTRRDLALPDTEPRYRAVAELGQWEVYAARCTRGRNVATYRAAAS